MKALISSILMLITFTATASSPRRFALPKEDFLYKCSAEISEQFDSAVYEFTVTLSDLNRENKYDKYIISNDELWTLKSDSMPMKHLAGHSIDFHFGVVGTEDEDKAVISATINSEYAAADFSAKSHFTSKEEFRTGGRLMDRSHGSVDISLDVSCKRLK